MCPTALRSSSGGGTPAAPSPNEALIRDALARLHDPVVLRRHPLVDLLGEDATSPHADAGTRLRRWLLDGIERLRPPPRTPENDRAWRAHRLLHARYVDGLDTAGAQRLLGLAKSQYHAELGRAVRALADVLVQRGAGATAAASGAGTGGAPGRPGGGAAPATNLVPALTSFVGRERELAEVRSLLEGARLLTLTGTGGCGKTRLACTVAESSLDQYHHVCLVELAALSAGEQVPHQVASVMGVQERPDEPLATTLARTLRDQRVLLLLDNCEHLLDECARFAEHLLARCPTLTVLATSRQALDAAGEVTWRVPSLPVPRAAPAQPDANELETIRRSDAVRLFVERARSAHPAFELTAENAAAVAMICHRLDGIPLAIELAAARIGALAPVQIEARLDQRFQLLTRGGRTALPRHQTLRALVEWSYELLSDSERRLFDRLAVFAGGLSLEAVEAVCGDTDAPVVDTLVRLVEKSLVVADAIDTAVGGAVRYRLLETLRQFAEQKLAARGEVAAVRRRHALYFARLAARELPVVKALGNVEFLDRLAQEVDNIRALQRWVLETGDAALGLTLPEKLRFFWYDRGHMSEARAWMATLLALPGSTPRTVPRATALYVAGYLAWQQGDLSAAQGLLRESLDIGRELGDLPSVGLASEYLGRALLDAGELAEARTWLEEARAVWAQLGKPQDTAVLTLGHVARYSGAYDKARTLYERCLSSFRSRDSEWLVVITLGHLGATALEEGDLDSARARAAECLIQSQLVGYRGHVPEALEVAAGVAAAAGHAERAARLAGAADALRERANTTRSPLEEATLARWLEAARRALGEPAWAAERAEGQQMSLEQATAYAVAWLKPMLDHD